MVNPLYPFLTHPRFPAFWFLCLGCFSACLSQHGSFIAEGNHLVNATSPYLLQHAYNPVDWFPWGEAAFEKAREENKLVVISIGYAACHWCHVMEEESFEDSTVASLMNEKFVSIKVDREERPDIDNIYMTACQLMSKQGCGWPLNIVALPDKRPIFAGTYFPKDNWMDILGRVDQIYRDQPAKAEDLAGRLLAAIEGIQGIQPEGNPEAFTPADFENIMADFLATQDTVWGGLAGSPKFPLPNNLLFLQHATHQLDLPWGMRYLRTALRRMANGGLYDHVGGGFARYSVDAKWHIPHFEKMLYDNGQLVSLYAKAYQQTRDPVYEQVVMETLGFVEREMMGPEGGFYSSLDADSEGEEGKYYVWTWQELSAILGQDLELFAAYFQVSPQGNWEGGKNVLWRADQPDKVAQRFNLPLAVMEEKIQACLKRLFEARKLRVRPGLDHKMIVAWNGIMLKGWVEAYRVFQQPHMLETALRNAKFIKEKCMNPQTGQLIRVYNAGPGEVMGFLDDYAFSALAFIELYQATFDPQWLETAALITQYASKHFYDPVTGMFFYADKSEEAILTPIRETDDHVMPSGNASMARVLFAMGTYLYKDDWLEMAKNMMGKMRNALSKAPGQYSQWGMLMLFLMEPPYEVAIVGKEAGTIRAALDAHYLPQVFYLGGEKEGNLELLQNKWVQGQTTVYVCRNKYCKLPVLTADEALSLIQE